MSRAYYNEYDPFAAAWLRELIADGLIAPGDVDERSIVDVRPADLDGYDQCHFFAGIGVWSLALRSAKWPDDRPIWTASCPCQPFSAAGKGGGFADERHLWPHLYWLIRQRRPELVIGEQVSSDDGLAWLDVVQADLDQAGYTSGALDTCAAGFGAPHIRQRLYWVAHASGAGLPQRESVAVRGEGRGSEGRAVEQRSGACAFGLGVTASGGCERQRDASAHGIALPADARDGRVAHADAAGPSVKRRELPQDGDAQSWAHAHGRGEAHRPGPTNGLWRDADWLGCRDGKWWPVESSPLSLADAGAIRRALDEGSGPHFHFPLAATGSIKNRVGMLRGAGNALNLGQATGFIESVIEVLHDQQ